jgi:hypothetical protein
MKLRWWLAEASASSLSFFFFVTVVVSAGCDPFVLSGDEDLSKNLFLNILY